MTTQQDKEMLKDELREKALEYHRNEPCGKLAIQATKPLANQHDLALAYSPGVAVACEEIAADPAQAASLTGRGNLVAVISNGTAVLGLGNIGPLAGKPVMEGKAVLFKKFSGIDVFDLEIAESDPDKLVDIIASLEPTFGGINLEDIKAPECFIVEQKLKERLNIPVFHDDQHGTAIIVGAAVVNALKIIGKDISKVKLVATGAGAAAIACLNLLCSLGLNKENILVCDRQGVIHRNRIEDMDPYKEAYKADTDARTLSEAIIGADIYLGLSGPDTLKQDMCKAMADRPLILALANPTPEILPELAKEARPDAIIATGRSDYPNQVNNVLCFPYIFRGALDVGATTINEEMKIACVHAIADLAMAETSEVVAKAYGGSSLKFGEEYLIPKPFDPRLIVRIAPAVAKAAIESGVATRPIDDFKVYRQKLIQFVFQTGFLMKPIFDQAKQKPKRIVYAEGEEPRILQTMQQVVEEGLAFPILVGRPEVVESRLEELGISLTAGKDYEIVNPQKDERYYEYWTHYHQIMGRKGISPSAAKTVVRTRTTAIAALMLARGEAEAMLCGTVGPFKKHLQHVDDIIGKAEGVSGFSTVIALVLPSGTFFVCDTHVIAEPDSREIAEMTILAAQTVRRFGIKPRVALISHSNFGSRDTESSQKMRDALAILEELEPQLVVEGEMHADAALSEEIRSQVFSNSRLKGKANMLVMPNIDAANISYNLLRMLGGGVSIGPILVGAAKPAYIATTAATVRGLVNMTALAVVEAQQRDEDRQIKLC